MLKRACIMMIILFLVICAFPFLVTEEVHGHTNIPTITVMRENTAAVIQTPQQVTNELKVPIAKTKQTWALVNFIAMITTVVVSLILTILGWYNRWIRRKIILDEAHQRSYQFWLRNKIMFRIINIILAIISIIIFILTENILLSMVIVDRFTPVMIALTILAIGIALFSKYSIKEFYPYNKL